MLDKLPQGWFRLYGVLQTRALAHGGELLYELDLSAGGSFMQAGRSLSQKPIQRVFAFRFYFGLMWMSLAASFCYLHAAHVNLEWQNTFDVVLTEINVIRTRSAQIALAGLGKKERAIKADR